MAESIKDAKKRVAEAGGLLPNESLEQALIRIDGNGLDKLGRKVLSDHNSTGVALKAWLDVEIVAAKNLKYSDGRPVLTGEVTSVALSGLWAEARRVYQDRLTEDGMWREVVETLKSQGWTPPKIANSHEELDALKVGALVRDFKLGLVFKTKNGFITADDEPVAVKDLTRNGFVVYPNEDKK